MTKLSANSSLISLVLGIGQKRNLNNFIFFQETYRDITTKVQSSQKKYM